MSRGPSDWHPWGESFPDWLDNGRLVEVEYADGSRVSGELYITDFYPDGEGDEFPVFVVKVGGDELSFADHERFRYLT